jgi:hypothetical protein
MIGTVSVSTFAANRLNGEPVPADLKVLLPNSDELFELTGIRLQTQKDWAPWLDTSHLSARELADPELSAHLLATRKVCELITFVASEEDGHYLGYWQGPQKRPIAESPIVVLDNDGQFGLCPGYCFAEAILSRVTGEERFQELRDFLGNLGLRFHHRTQDDLPSWEMTPTPEAIQQELYRQYRMA